MPYFSFSLKQSFLNSTLRNNLLNYKLETDVKYFSKNTNIWKILNKKNVSIHLNSICIEKRKDYIQGCSSVLFLMPPSIGLGDSIEYALAIKNIINKKLFKKIGIGFSENYSYIFTKLFKFENVYNNFISEKNLMNYETSFHFTKEIKNFKDQKYNRSDIEKEICNFFKIKVKRNYRKTKNEVKKITLFPISTSPIRTLPVNVINSIISKFSKKIKIDLVLDNFYQTSKFVVPRINSNNVNFIFHYELEDLVKIIKNIDYGIFIDSGPLHLAKILNKRGLFIETSVSHQKLLKNFNNFEIIKNTYSSKYCKAPCGLTNLFNINNSMGCFDTHKMKYSDIMKKNLKKNLHRGIVKNKYNEFMIEPVECIKNIDLKQILNNIEKIL